MNASPSAEFEKLISRAEKITTSPKQVRTVTARRWRKDALTWMRKHASGSSALLEMLALRSPRNSDSAREWERNYYASDGDIANISRGVRALTRAAEQVPELRERVKTARSPVERPVPTEIVESLARLREDHPAEIPLGFVLMSFAQTRAHNAIYDAIREGCDRRGARAVRADDKAYHDDLYWNVVTYLHAADFGVAVFERLQAEAFNPNVSFELGYLFALRKPGLLLKDQTLRTLHTDLMGKLYQVFDPQSPEQSIPTTVASWLGEKGLGVARVKPSEVVQARYGAGEQWQDVTRAIRVWLNSGQPSLSVSNVALGGDPAYGSIKTLEIELRGPDGKVATSAIPEGHTLSAKNLVTPTRDDF